MVIRQSPLADRDRGATAVEYALIIAGIAVVIVAAVLVLGRTLDDTYTTAGQALAGEPQDNGGGVVPDPCLDLTFDPAFFTCAAGVVTGTCPVGSSQPAPNDYSCVEDSLPACPSRSLGVVSAPKHTGSGNGSYAYNVLGGVAGAQLSVATMTSGDGAIGYAAGGTVTWTYPSGNRSAVVSFTYAGTGCTTGNGSFTFDAR